MLPKSKYSVDGRGYDCLKSKIIGRTYRPLWAPLQVSSIECWDMIYTKKCESNLMLCEEDRCYFIEKPKLDFALWNTREFEIINCEYYKMKPHLCFEDGLLVGQGECYAKREFCSFGDKMIVWKRDIINSCLFKFIGKINFTKIDNIFYSDKEKILLETYSKEHECNMVLVKTNDDIYITINNTAELKIDETSINQLKDLTLADTDYKVFNLFTKLKTMMSVKFSYSIMAFLKTFRGYNKIYRINDQYGNDLNILAEKAELYKLECISLTRVTFNNILIECYTDMQCDIASSKYIHLNDFSLYLRKNKQILRLNYTQMVIHLHRDQLNFKDLDFNHYGKLFNFVEKETSNKDQLILTMVQTEKL
ncbi:hypothetical protein BpHYR1_044986 [Brachionus plicatilis]|uniref:Uncharacterized protein n=1 Tax=Brachionus plicatilis TaxID=10195 RepID=A0A3M7T5T9_BRAPC|nr:hypothetical protein BpHYR1_044986 [Brachionus plicatilis]